MLNAVFNSMILFLMEKRKNVDGYLIGDKVPEVIYNLHKYNKYYERYSVEVAEMEPLAMLGMIGRE